MRKVLKIIMICIMILGIALSVLNFTAVDNQALGAFNGTYDPDTGDCTGPGLNCNNAPFRDIKRYY